MTASISSKRIGHSQRGGHNRRRRGAKVDVDGDLVMGGITRTDNNRISKTKIRNPGSRDSTPTHHTSASAPRRGTFTSANIQREILRHAASKTQSARVTRSTTTSHGSGLVDVTIGGWKNSLASSNDDGGVSSLVAFLEKRFTIFQNKGHTTPPKPPYKIKKHRTEGDNLIISIPSSDITTFLRLDGYEFARSKITVTRGKDTSNQRPKSPEATNEVRELLKGILSVRYNPETKLLDLSALAQDPKLLELGVVNASSSTQSKFFPAMMKICDDIFQTPQAKQEAVVSISLARNDLTNLKWVTSMAPTFPDILNLDLSGNQLPDLSSLAFWTRKLKRLDHLVLTGNPLEQSVPNFNIEVAKLFPSLRTLNGIRIRSDEEASEHGQLVTALSQRTGMRADYSKQCLEENGWDMDKAMVAFQNAKAALPPDAFVQT
jgi:nuclear RNA export factor